MIYFTSDEHYSHFNIIKYCNRPFKDEKEMNAILISNHNSTISNNDVVYHLGDFAFHFNTVREVFPKLNGKHILIMGNHDPCFPHFKNKSYTSIQDYLNLGFSEIRMQDKIQIDKFELDICHFPYFDDIKDRYMNYSLPKSNKYLLHGHIHNKWKINNKMINVGVDVWDYKPVSILKIKELLYEQEKSS